jgi:hypothetical protein
MITLTKELKLSIDLIWKKKCEEVVSARLSAEVRTGLETNGWPPFGNEGDCRFSRLRQQSVQRHYVSLCYPNLEYGEHPESIHNENEQ